MPKTHLHFLRSCFFLQLLFFSGCVSKIATVQQNIDRYKDQSVSVRGKVQETLTIPGIQTGIYQIKDNSGQIWVKGWRNQARVIDKCSKSCCHGNM